LLGSFSDFFRVGRFQLTCPEPNRSEKDRAH
jgi:hypothetical protein